jgi:ATP-dependent Lon protease
MSTTLETPPAPSALPVLPLRNAVLFPRQAMPLAVGRAASVAAVQAAVSSEDKLLLVASQIDPSEEETQASNLFSVGTLAVIKQLSPSGESVQVVVHGVERAAIVRVEQEQPYLAATVRKLPDPDDRSTETEALHRSVLDLAARLIAESNPAVQALVSRLLGESDRPIDHIFVLGSVFSLGLATEQRLLAATRIAEALRLLHAQLTREAQIQEVRRKIASETQTEMSREQREYFLRQQLKAIQAELGEESPEAAAAAELRARLEQADLPDAVRREADRELDRLERLPGGAPDYQLTWTYLEFIAELPWNRTTEDNLDLTDARRTLDEDHYDLRDVKERIIEHLAVMKLNPQAKAPMLCFVGPPGVGKTSLGRSIARALGRRFERMSLGGLSDEAELRGHRRTYIGAMPGRILQAVRRAGVRNPLLMLDEVDKLGRDFRGDPAAALLEILDPAQNCEFHDNYLDIAFDLSKVFFITTANALENIPRPLIDRMETLRLSGYADAEKLAIARRYLIPRQVREAGLPPDQLAIGDDALVRIVRRYAREAGVRELERTIGSLCRKIATRYALGDARPAALRPEDLSGLLGPEKFFQEDARQKLAPGVAAGLAWTEAGGEVLYVEAVRLAGEKALTLTGQLGDVMRESATAARSWVTSRAADLGIDADALQGGVHIHVPAGATPKDGPSAGVTMAAALASLYSGQAVRSDTALTGEITLSGLVLPVGGLKEKILAAHRAGIRRIVLPRQNCQDLGELPDDVRNAMEFVPVDRLEEVLEAAIGRLDRPAPLAVGG